MNKDYCDKTMTGSRVHKYNGNDIIGNDIIIVGKCNILQLLFYFCGLAINCFNHVRDLTGRCNTSAVRLQRERVDYRGSAVLPRQQSSGKQVCKKTSLILLA